MSRRPSFRDLYRHSEDDRIREIGDAAMMGGTIGVMLETNQPDKIARYIEKVTTRYPGVGVVDQTANDTITLVRFKLKPRTHAASQ